MPSTRLKHAKLEAPIASATTTRSASFLIPTSPQPILEDNDDESETEATTTTSTTSAAATSPAPNGNVRDANQSFQSSPHHNHRENRRRKGRALYHLIAHQRNDELEGVGKMIPIDEGVGVIDFDQEQQQLSSEIEDEYDENNNFGGREEASNLMNVRFLEHPNVLMSSTLQDVLFMNFFPDSKFSLCGVQVLDGESVVKLVKFVVLTLTGIASMFVLIRKIGWEHDSKMHLSDWWLFESNLVLLDSMFFFVVGRLQNQRGVDHLAWIATAFGANLYASGITKLPFLQHSLTLYEMHCLWSWKLWIFVGILVPLIVMIVLLHVHESVRRGVFLSKLMELSFSVLLFLLPPLSSDYFHFHHWFAGWMLGMHCNLDPWWSRSTMAWCWGLYINGIAAYGRDPLLTCGYAYWLSLDLRCPYLECYLDALANDHGNNANSTVKPMIAPSWRNCSTKGYHP